MKLPSSAILRKFFHWIRSKDFLIFLFFLFVAGFFWTMLALKDVVEYEVEFPVNVVHVPENVTLNCESTDTVVVAKRKEYSVIGFDTMRVVIRDNAYNILGYLFNKVSININYTKGDEDKISVSTSDLVKKAKLDKSVEVITIKPERFEIYYRYGDFKYKPVAIYGSITAADKYFLESIKVVPESVRVMGAPARLATIDSVRTRYVRITDVTEKDEPKKVGLQQHKGVTLGVKEVKVVATADVLSDMEREVEIEPINVPDNKLLRTIPGRVKVKFSAPSKMGKNITKDDFKVVVDYNEIRNDNNKQSIHLNLIRKPSFVKSNNVFLEVKEVDYKIEQR
jgi:hypothetical protein